MLERLPGILFAALALVANVSCRHAEPNPTTYVTEYGLGPDKWATAWLLTQHPQANAALRVVPAGAALETGTPFTGTPFDVPGARIRRIQSAASFEVAHRALQLRDPAVERLAQIVHHIEVDFWSSDGPPEADVIEGAYRNLQYRHGRQRVTPQCYVAFFDRVYDLLNDVDARGLEMDADRLDMTCEELVRAATVRRELVPEVPVADVLSAMAAGRRVVFVDVREADEFTEAHIPGALNIPLRAAGQHLAAQFKGAEYVVSYCVKDFRGFEMAKALADAGVRHSVIMRPYGIKGWVQLGLPVTGEKALPERAALEDLDACLQAHGECLRQRAQGGSS